MNRLRLEIGMRVGFIGAGPRCRVWQCAHNQYTGQRIGYGHEPTVW
jgi:hypothetical protein